MKSEQSALQVRALTKRFDRVAVDALDLPAASEKTLWDYLTTAADSLVNDLGAGVSSPD